MTTAWCVRQSKLDDETDDKLTAFAADGWTVHSTSSYWNPVSPPTEAATLVIVAYREVADEGAAAAPVAAMTPRKARIEGSYQEAMNSGETFEQRFERWSDDTETWDQAVLAAV